MDNIHMILHMVSASLLSFHQVTIADVVVRILVMSIVDTTLLGLIPV